MTTTTTALGACPECSTSIPSHKLLIAYRTDDGESMYAECPDCLTVVHPA